MAVRIDIDHQRRLVEVRAEGEVGLKDVEAFLDTIIVENALSYRKLIDARNAEAKYIAADLVQLEARLTLYAHVDRRGAVAMVVDPKYVDLLDRLLQAGRPRRPGCTFLDATEAERWLVEQPEA
ncbi:MAG: hypothetical protein KIS73_17630 [Enhydrobacter sp.]|nr:hypothetical protein [Enhydrobacter sp.]